VDLTDETGLGTSAVQQSAGAAADTGGETGAGIIYVLACPLPGSERTPAYLLHNVGGIDCVLGYTDLTRLVECCGPHQPWLAVRLDALIADLRDQQLPGPVANLPLAPGAWWGVDGPPWDMAALVASARAPRTTAQEGRS
jgi:hypothetical protein